MNSRVYCGRGSMELYGATLVTLVFFTLSCSLRLFFSSTGTGDKVGRQSEEDEVKKDEAAKNV